MSSGRRVVHRALAIPPMLVALAGAACTDGSTGPAAPLDAPAAASRAEAPNTVAVCHKGKAGARILNVDRAALTAHLGHGDYVTSLRVSHETDAAGDGVHFVRITDAVLAARQTRMARGETETAACRITISVSADTFTGSFDAGADPALERFPLLIDVPDVTLLGALQMRVDERGRATGDGQAASGATVLAPDRGLEFLPNTEAMIVVAGHPAGATGNGAVIEGFAFHSGRSDGSSGGMGIIALRVRDLVIRGDRFEPGLATAGDLRSSSATIERNYAIRLGDNCAFCLAGPGSYRASGNRLVDGGLGGIYVGAAIADMPFALGAAPVTTVEPDVLPAAASVTAVLDNNDIRGHVRLPIGFAVRILALGPGTAKIPQSSHVQLSNNDITGNTFGVIVDAGFPQANTLLHGDVDVTLNGNSIHGNCQTNLLVAFTRHTGALGLTANPYLQNSTIRLDLGGDLNWTDAWFSHPAGYGNTLSVDGTTVVNGARQFYDATACPGL
jgi:hypothetical protein